MPVATVVGGTLKLLTIPPSATGSDATLNDMIIWPSAMAIIGTHDACCSVCSCEIGMACTDIVLLRISLDLSCTQISDRKQRITSNAPPHGSAFETNKSIPKRWERN